MTWTIDLTRMEEDCGTEFELDVIVLCCEYTEYKDIKEFQNDYDEGFIIQSF